MEERNKNIIVKTYIGSLEIAQTGCAFYIKRLQCAYEYKSKKGIGIC